MTIQRIDLKFFLSFSLFRTIRFLSMYYVTLSSILIKTPIYFFYYLILLFKILYKNFDKSYCSFERKKKSFYIYNLLLLRIKYCKFFQFLKFLFRIWLNLSIIFSLCKICNTYVMKEYMNEKYIICIKSLRYDSRFVKFKKKKLMHNDSRIDKFLFWK